MIAELDLYHLKVPISDLIELGLKTGSEAKLYSTDLTQVFTAFPITFPGFRFDPTAKLAKPKQAAEKSSIVCKVSVVVLMGIG